jgi:hypothetical protein
MDAEKHSIFMSQQVPTDFSCLQNCFHVLPTNVDALTERMGKFLVFELKHGEQFSVGQKRALREWAGQPNFTILLIDCEHSEVNALGGRDFLPESFRVLKARGVQSPPYKTNVGDFAARYDIWTRTPSDGAIPFTCSPEEFQEKYLHWLPEHQRKSALQSVQSARTSEAV